LASKIKNLINQLMTDSKQAQRLAGPRYTAMMAWYSPLA